MSNADLVPVLNGTPPLTSGTHGPAMTVEQAYESWTTLSLFVKLVLHQGIDYGVIPGTNQPPTLLLAGAEKLTSFFGLGVQLAVIDQVLDWTGQDHGGEPFFYFNTECILTSRTGQVWRLAASANSWEEKWRYRYVPRNQVPAHLDPNKLPQKGGTVFEFQFAIDQRATTGQYGKPAEYWDAWVAAIAAGQATPKQRKSKKGADLAGWERDDTLYAMPNPRIFEQVNTVQAISAKRAFVRCVNYAVGASQFFTTDMEKLYHQDEEGQHEEGEGTTSDLQTIAVTLTEARQRLVLELTRGVGGEPIWFSSPQAIKAALDELELTFNKIEDYAGVKKALIEYAQAHR